MENHKLSTKLPTKLRNAIERELETDEAIQWIEQPIPRFWTRSTVGTCVTLLIPFLFFSFTAFSTLEQATQMRRSLVEFVGTPAIAVFFLGTITPLFLIFFIPITHWLSLRQTVYVVTNERALIFFVSGRSTKITSFIPSELRVVSRRETKDSTGDLIVYLHKWKDYDGDIHTEEMGFTQIRNPKALEKVLLHLKSTNNSPQE